MFEEFKNKVLFVTGAASGMGRAVAVRFGGLGCKVAVAARRPDAGAETVRLVKEAGGDAMFVPCDVADDASVKAAIDTTVAAWGSIDFAFNNAGCGADGVHIPFVPLTEVTEGDWDKVIDTNLKGTFHCMRAAIRPMMKKRRGRIISISSVVGLMGNAGQINYAASKAGVIGMTKSLAREVASRHITVNAVAPGFIKTDMTAVLSDSVKEGILHGIPLGELGEAEDVANAVLYLASDEAAYITGQIISVDGGMAM